ncbi:hypothetical protein [Streptomyces filamentosus]|uniref:hypothetical protein n=1 Tax=Streptomyces filamentosus TaxID=67294 RepID=UPI003B520CF8
MTDDTTDLATQAFIAHRNLLLTVAYEMLGSAAASTVSMRVEQVSWFSHPTFRGPTGGWKASRDTDRASDPVPRA